MTQLKTISGGLFVLFIAFSAWHMGALTLPYVQAPYPTDIDFLEAKQNEVAIPHWLIAFYIHIVSSTIVITCGLTQFSRTLMFRYPKIHRTIGKMYAFLILGVAAPSGFVMAWYGSGGFYAQIAFVLQAMFWWGMTFMAYQTIRKKDILNHGKYMLRSYAMTLSAITLRAATYAASYYKLSNDIFCPNESYQWLCFPDFYIIVAWLSWIVNLLIAEGLIFAGTMRYYTSK